MKTKNFYQHYNYNAYKNVIIIVNKIIMVKKILMGQSSSSFLEQLSSPCPLLPIGQIQNERISQHLPAADIATNKSIQHVINWFLITLQIGERNVRTYCSRN